MPDHRYTSAAELARKIRQRELSPVDVVDDALDRIERLNDRTNSFITILEDDARKRAQEAEEAVANGQLLGPLHGVPIAIKDLFDFKADVRNTFGSAPFEEFVPEVSATYIRRLEEAGAIIVGKTNTPEFGHKGTTDNELFGPTSTPFDLGRNAGGSSGGSAAAVADGLVPIAQGSDGGGSIRIPASFCGVYGLKPSFGLVAQAVRPDAFLTHTPFIHSGGPITRTVEDAALMMEGMAGSHPRDPLSFDSNLDFLGAIDEDIEGYDVAYSPDYSVFPIDSRVRAVIDDAVGAFETAGASVQRVEVDIEHSHTELTDIWIRQIGMLYQSMLIGFEDQGIDLLEDHREELTPAFAELIEDTYDLSVRQYKQDEHIRTEVYDAIQDVLDEYDILVGPSLAVPPVENAVDESTKGPTEVDGEPIDPLIGWCCTYLTNFTGHPVASIPAGLTDEGLPVGMEIIGNRLADDEVLTASAVFERVRPWQQTYPDR